MEPIPHGTREETPEVYALVGESGTGKSHQALLVAHDYDINYIVDDGLLIKDGRIIAGRSAKRENTKLAAVRRAIFSDPEHAQEVKRELERAAPTRVLILGTSRKMVKRITSALGLPRPETIISIEEIADPWDIKKAQRLRREQGKHVIPAATFEVKKSFSGYLVHPLKLFLEGKKVRRRVMIEKSVVQPTYSSLGRFYIADTVVASIATRVCEGEPGIAKTLGVSVQIRPEGVEIDLEVTARYGTYLPRVLIAAQEAVKSRIEDLTSLNVIGVNITASKLVLGNRRGMERSSGLVFEN